MDPQVVVVGAGPTGLTLAIDLGMRGVRCLVIERNEAPQFLPKMERCNARTMEIYRRIGLSERIRAAGLPEDWPMDKFIVLSLMQPPLLHLPYPSVREARSEIARTFDGSLPLEPYQLISQYTLEPLLRKVAEATPNIRIRYDHELLSFSQDGREVRSSVRGPGGRVVEIRSDYLVGCDGGTSTVRRHLGISLVGNQDQMLRLRQSLHVCPDLWARVPIARGRHYHVADDRSTQLIVQDSTHHFTLHSIVESDDEMIDMFRRVVGAPVAFDTLYVGEWKQNLLLAERYRGGRVLLAGDAAHLVIPTGGLGMNSGVGDAIDLSWKLAAVLGGWGGPRLLDSYEIERRRVGHWNVRASREATLGRRKWRSMWRPNIGDDSPEGAATRAALTRVAEDEQHKASEMFGAELGYQYFGSPIVWPETGDGPPYDPYAYAPTTWPGVRLPHAWRDDGTAVQDAIGFDRGFTLLRLGGARPNTRAVASAFSGLGAPFRTLDIPDERVRDLYGCDLLLLRPDLHVAWRGHRLPPAERLASTVTGHASADPGAGMEPTRGQTAGSGRPT